MFKVTGRVPNNKVRDQLVEYTFLRDTWADWDVEARNASEFRIDFECPTQRSSEWWRDVLSSFGVVDLKIAHRGDWEEVQ